VEIAWWSGERISERSEFVDHDGAATTMEL
jgi:hypothetical protein